MRQFILIIFGILLYNCSNSQQNSNFDLFIQNFKSCEFPISPIDVLHSHEKEWEHYISEKDFDTYFRKPSDSLWVFDGKHQYVFGGKFDVNLNIVSVFYNRVYFADDIDNQIAEIVLCTFNSKGELISSLAIAGGYGDSVTFSSIIHNSRKIEVTYKKYNAENVEETSKYFEILETGIIKENESVNK